MIIWCLLIALLTPALPALAVGAHYYVDSVSGSDSNSGTATDWPWRTLSKVNGYAFQPGDVIHFKSDCVWDGTLQIQRSGTMGSPITFTSYGSGALPILKNTAPASTWPKAVLVHSDWTVIEGLQIRDTYEAGIYIKSGADHNVVRLCQVTNVGIGVAVYGQYNLVAYNAIHDLSMVVNTSGGDDDYGAVGVWLFSSNNEVAYNLMQRCRANSYDYGVDGGAVEFYGAVNNSYVHHNWAQDNEGFLEVGGDASAGHEAKNSIVAYNVLVDNVRALHFNLGAYQYASDVDNFRFEHNTVVESGSWQTAINFISGELTGEQLIWRNNIVSGFYKLARKLNGGAETASTAFTHQYNLYQGIGVSFALGAGETTGDPRFQNAAERLYTLQASSPAINTGVDLGYTSDYAGEAVPSGAKPERGAFEYVTAQPTATPTSTNTAAPPTSTPTRTATSTAVPPTSTPTRTAVPPTSTPTRTAVPPTSTPTSTAVPPTITPTSTAVPPTSTPTSTTVPPTSTPTSTATSTSVPPNGTSVPPTSTPTPTATSTSVQPNGTSVPPTSMPTSTSVPPTSTPTFTPTNTAVPPTSTPMPTPTLRRKRVIRFEPGWNLVAFPADLSANDAANSLMSASSRCERIWAYDAADVANPWKRHDADAPPFANDLQEINAQMGVWVYVSDGFEMEVGWEEPAELALREGWNLVGYPGEEAMSVADALSGIAGLCARVHGYDASAQSWLTWDASQPGQATLTQMEPGRGYWVLVTGACNWTAP